jgi:hypothetical protein
VPKKNTQTRSYTLRLKAASDCEDWLPLWKRLFLTHYAVCQGARLFGELYLNLRGGLSPSLADQVGTDGSPEERAEAVRGSRRMLALGWLSVEDTQVGEMHVDDLRPFGPGHKLTDNEASELLREILGQKGVQGDVQQEWIDDCVGALTANIRPDAQWVNRAKVFYDWQKGFSQFGADMPEHARKILFQMCGSDFVTLTLPQEEAVLSEADKPEDETEPTEGEEAQEEKVGEAAKEPSKASRGAYGDLFGGDPEEKQARSRSKAENADKILTFLRGASEEESFKDMLLGWRQSQGWDQLDTTNPEKYPAEVTFSGAPTAVAKRYRKLLVSVGLWPQSSKEDGEKGTPRQQAAKKYASKVAHLSSQQAKIRVNALDLLSACEELAPGTTDDSGKEEDRSTNTDDRVFKPQWAEDIQKRLATSTGSGFSDRSASEFRRLMFAIAARRLSQTQSWIKRNEVERHKASLRKDAAASKLRELDPNGWAQDWLHEYEESRASETESQSDYRITKRAIAACDEVIAAWKATTTPQERDDKTAEVQADCEKFGHADLFHDLASKLRGEVVWLKSDGSTTADILKEWVKLKQAEFDESRFKIPRFCHPDPFHHPAWCEFGGSSTPKVWYAWSCKGKPEKPEPGGDADGLQRLWMLLPDFDTNQAKAVSLRWISKRLWKDLGGDKANADPAGAPRLDRLGRAAATPGTAITKQVFFPFTKEAKWNARLQADREALEALEDLWDDEKREWTDGGRALKYLRWFVTFAPELAKASGPWGELRDQLGWKRFPIPEWNKKQKREGHAKLILSRLPGLRVLSVDLGHRYAAACAVWEAITAEQMTKACQDHAHRPQQAHDMFIHLTRKVKKRKKRLGAWAEVEVEENTVYRRIGPDQLSDGSEHPAPWCRLDRQFLIKLQGEESPARFATDEERRMVQQFEEKVGLVRIKPRKADDWRVDELMADVMRTCRLALQRHARRAKIAWALNPATSSVFGMGGKKTDFETGDATHVKLLTDTLLDWHSLASDSKWDDRAARDLWNAHIALIADHLQIQEPKRDPDAIDDRTRQQRRKDEGALRQVLEPAAKKLADTDRAVMHDAWSKRWTQDDGLERRCADFEHTVIKDEDGRNCSRTMAKRETWGWHAAFRLLTDWIMGWHLPTVEPKGWRRQVGGLSVTRIATMRSLYQLHKAFAMRARPDEPRGDPKKGDIGVAQSLLDAMERMRNQRVKQLASRIAEAALGIGSENRERHWAGDANTMRPRERIADPRFAPCHAVVIESLRRYKPDELQTRRENRQLMNWSASKVRKYLDEARQLCGLYLYEVMPHYTSRQDSRTGLPGYRCDDLAVEDFIKPCRAVKAAAKNLTKDKLSEDATFEQRFPEALNTVRGGKGKAEDRFLVELFARWNGQTNQWTDAHGIRWTLQEEGKWFLSPGQDGTIKKDKIYKHPGPVRLIAKGGEHFVASLDHNGQIVQGSSRGLQADLNAAANIGLRALLDPDFPGKWWYVPCEEIKKAQSAIPLLKYTRGSACFPFDPTQFGSLTKELENGTEGAKEITNFWSDPSAPSLRNGTDGGYWWPTRAYWPWVRKRVVAILRKLNGLPECHIEDLNPEETTEPPF